VGGNQPNFASLEGERVAAEYGFATLPVDPFHVAKAASIDVIAKEVRGASGMLIRVGDYFTIAYAAHLPNEGFQRFSVSHELGHYFLRGHPDAVLDASGIHVSNAGFIAKDPYEQEADQFAAGLLMPRKLFTKAIADAGEGLAAIEHLAKCCRTSLTATAIRLAELTDEPLAVIVSDQDHVLFCKMSKRFSEYRNLTWLQKGTRIPRRTATAAFVANPGRILEADTSDDVVDIADWFGSGGPLRLVEEVVGLGDYCKVLTVLTPDAAPDFEDNDDYDEDSRWSPSFGR
jgi:Zn-dependent peptidase ImmA (M78 family)